MSTGSLDSFARDREIDRDKRLLLGRDAFSPLHDCLGQRVTFHALKAEFDGENMVEARDIVIQHWLGRRSEPKSGHRPGSQFVRIGLITEDVGFPENCGVPSRFTVAISTVEELTDQFEPIGEAGGAWAIHGVQVGRRGCMKRRLLRIDVLGEALSVDCSDDVTREVAFSVPVTVETRLEFYFDDDTLYGIDHLGGARVYISKGRARPFDQDFESMELYHRFELDDL